MHVAVVRKVLQSFFPSLPHSQNVKTLLRRVTGWLCDPPPPLTIMMIFGMLLVRLTVVVVVVVVMMKGQA